MLRIPIVLGVSVFFHWFLLRTSGAWFVDGNSPSGNNHKSSRTQERISLELELKGKFKGDRSQQSKSGTLSFSKIKFQKSHSIPISGSITTIGTTTTTTTTTKTASATTKTNNSASAFASTTVTGPDSSQTNPIIYSPTPHYPVEALERHLEGRVLIKIETDGAGAVNSWGLEQSTGHEILDEAALSAVKEWRLAPRSAYLIPFTFRIK